VLVVTVDELDAELLGQPAPHGGLAGAFDAHQDHDGTPRARHRRHCSGAGRIDRKSQTSWFVTRFNRRPSGWPWRAA
jgi:hypothetical protein